jgi:hypothetical protein
MAGMIAAPPLRKRKTMKGLVALAMLFLLGCGQKSDDVAQPSTPQPRASQPSTPSQPQATANPKGPPSGGKAAAPIPIYVTPFYNSEGPQVDVGPFSKQLAAANADTITEVAAAMKKQWDSLPVAAMYVAAIRHYDLGQKDEAVYWFYSAQYRARLFASILSDKNPKSIGGSAFEASAAHGAFQQLAGEYINGYAFGKLDTLKATIKTVQSESGKSLPQFTAIYPKVSFIPAGEWPDKSKEVSAGLSKLLDMIETRADEIKIQRKQNGIEGKY